jgi:hypothetical protein
VKCIAHESFVPSSPLYNFMPSQRHHRSSVTYVSCRRKQAETALFLATHRKFSSDADEKTLHWSVYLHTLHQKAVQPRQQQDSSLRPASANATCTLQRPHREIQATRSHRNRIGAVSTDALCANCLVGTYPLTQPPLVKTNIHERLWQPMGLVGYPTSW